jgi:anhydro-N-acetylmuramic acid kinase
MSGTSLDGVDIALCEFTKTDSWKFEILFAQTFDYSEQWKEILAETEN